MTATLTIIGESAEFAEAMCEAHPTVRSHVESWTLTSHRHSATSRGKGLDVLAGDKAGFSHDARAIFERYAGTIFPLASRDGRVPLTRVPSHAIGLLTAALRLVDRARRAKTTLVFLDLPHTTEEFVVLAAAHALGIRYRAVMESSIDYLAVIPPSPFPFEAFVAGVTATDGGRLSERGTALAARLRGEYRNARPRYMREQDARRSIRRMALIAIKKMRRPSAEGLRRWSERRALEARYQGLTSNHAKDGFIYFPLHFQPERTTCPQGSIYFDQALALRRLLEIDQGTATVCVKEHPSTFLLGKTGWRDPGYWENMRINERVVFADVREDSFSLLDRCTAVATITGTVGIEAAARGKPLIAFGAHTYFDLPGLASIEDGAAIQLPPAPAPAAFDRWLASYEKCELVVDSRSTPLVTKRRDYSPIASGLMALCEPGRVKVKDGLRRLT